MNFYNNLGMAIAYNDGINIYAIILRQTTVSFLTIEKFNDIKIWKYIEKL